MGGDTTRKILMVALRKSSWLCLWTSSDACCCWLAGLLVVEDEVVFLLTLRLMLPTSLRQSCPPAAAAPPPPPPGPPSCVAAATGAAAEFDDEADEDGLNSRLARRLRQRPPPTAPPWPEDDTVVALPPLSRRTRLRKVPLRDSDDFAGCSDGGAGGAVPLLLGSTLSALPAPQDIIIIDDDDDDGGGDSGHVSCVIFHRTSFGSSAVGFRAYFEVMLDSTTLLLLLASSCQFRRRPPNTCHSVSLDLVHQPKTMFRVKDDARPVVCVCVSRAWRIDRPRNKTRVDPTVVVVV